MDEHVLRGMVRWPDVPAVYGWLALDRRGNWLIRGEPIANAVFASYIARNYEHDSEGRWFFQNGPQRVFVALAYTPFVYRLVSGATAQPALETHTGTRAAAVNGAWIDDCGALLLETEHGVGVVDDRDLDALLPFLIDANGNRLPDDTLEEVMGLFERGSQAPVWLTLGESNVKVKPIAVADVAARFGFIAAPQDPQAAPA